MPYAKIEKPRVNIRDQSMHFQKHVVIIMATTVVVVVVVVVAVLLPCRSQGPRGLRRRASAARLLRLWVRIPPGHECLSVVSVVCCQVEVSATD
jgi:hypothetical protein